MQRRRFKENLTSQQTFFTGAKTQSEAAVKASLIVAEEIANLSDTRKFVSSRTVKEKTPQF